MDFSTSKYFFTFLLFSCVLGINAQTVEVNNQFSGNQINIGAVLTGAEDPDSASASATTANAYSYIKIFIDENTPLGTNDAAIENQVGDFEDFSYSIKLKITATDYANGLYEEEKVFSLERYNYQAGDFVDNQYYKLENAKQVEVKVLELITEYPNVSSTATPANVTVELGFAATRYYALDEQTLPSLTITSQTYTDEDGNTWDRDVLLNWNSINGAERYELEWTWIDNFNQIVGGPDLTASQVELTEAQFQHNSSRISTSKTNYSIPLVYSKGYLVFRVRAVGRFVNEVDKELFGPWSISGSSLQTVQQWGSYYPVQNVNHDTKNWQFQASYAEDGKKKEVLSYFDGSLRNRQTITNINTDNLTIVGETVYDTQGRAAIEILPVPTSTVSNTSNEGLHYYKNFNQNMDGDKYNHLDFDWTVEEACNNLAKGMKASSGASKYYSDSELQNNYQDFVPDAQNFPFSQIEYTQDNTGRIARKGGVGPNHQLGTNNEMKYFYGIPTQQELNRLFGNNVGNANFYKKNVVVDPNLQVSVSYIDPKGKTIATALAGNHPANNDGKILEPLEDEVHGAHQTVVTDLLNKDNFADPDTNQDNNVLFTTGNFANYYDGLLSDSQRLVTTEPTDLKVDYSFTVPAKTFNSPENDMCFLYPLVYDLEIDVTNNCGESMLETNHFEPLKSTVGEYNYNATSGYIEATPNATTQLSYSLENPIPIPGLNVGAYGIKKELKVNEDALEVFAEDYVRRLTDKNNVCYVDWDDFAPNTSIEGCFQSCQDCIDGLGFSNKEEYRNYMLSPENGFYNVSDYGDGTTSSVEWQQLIARFEREFELMVEACMQPCRVDGTSLTNTNVAESISVVNAIGVMVSDMQPHGGQYGISYEADDEDDEEMTVTVDQSLGQEGAIYNIYNEGDENGENANQLVYIETNSGNPIFHDENINWRNPIHYKFTDSNGSPNHYFTPSGEIAYVYVEKIETPENSNQNPEYNPPLLAGISNNDLEPTTSPTTFMVEPQFLANLEDFVSSYQSNWGESLIVYHPEYKYLEYTIDVAEQISQINLNIYDEDNNSYTSTNITLNSDGFDNLLEEATSFTIAKNMGLLGNPCFLLEKDPFFTLQSGLGVDINGDSFYEVKNEIMKMALGCGNYVNNGDYEGMSASIIQVSYANAICNSIEVCENSDLTALTNQQVLSSVNNLSTTQKNRFWESYRGHYLSLKQKINYVLMNYYAASQGGYNGCIENGEYDSSLNGVDNVIEDYYNNNISSISFSEPSETVCNSITGDEYQYKTRRFIPIDNLYDSEEDNQDILDSLGEFADYHNLINSGLCPLALDLQAFLNGFVEENPDILGIRNYTGLYLSQDLFTNFGGIIGSNINLQIKGTPINSQDFSLDLMTSGGTIEKISLSLPANSFVWNEYGTDWMILHMDQLNYTNYINGNPDVFNFQILAVVKDFSTGTYSEVVISGETHAQIGECYIGDPTSPSGPGEVIDDVNCDSSVCTPPFIENKDEAFKDFFTEILNNGYYLSNSSVDIELSETVREWFLVMENISEEDVNNAKIVNFVHCKNSSLISTTLKLGLDYIILADNSSGVGVSFDFQSASSIESVVVMPFGNAGSGPGDGFFGVNGHGSGKWVNGNPYSYCYPSPNLSSYGIACGTGSSDLDYESSSSARSSLEQSSIESSTSRQNVLLGLIDTESQILLNSNNQTYVSDMLDCSTYNLEQVKLYYEINMKNLINAILNNGSANINLADQLPNAYSLFLKEFFYKNFIYSGYISEDWDFNPNQAKFIDSSSALANSEDSYIYFDEIDVKFRLFEGSLLNQVNHVENIVVNYGPDEWSDFVGVLTSYGNINYIDNDDNTITEYIRFDIDYKNRSYQSIFMGFCAHPQSCPCVPQTVAPVTCTPDSYIKFLKDLDRKVRDYRAPEYYNQEYFCSAKYQYLVDDYLYYLDKLNITSVQDMGYITIAEFGATEANYGYNGMTAIINEYANYYNNDYLPDFLDTHTETDSPMAWGDFVSIYFDVNPDICPPALLPVNVKINLPDVKSECDVFTKNITEAYNQDAYYAYVETLKQKFIKEYIEYATSAVVEHFDLSYFDKEYQYTLYYYDQAGNLTQTVPPEGVDRNNQQHTLKTEYKYNSLNQLVWQKTPDAGVTRFAYDALGRIVASQNEKQLNELSGNLEKYSYTRYDALGRIIEAGEVELSNGYQINSNGKLMYGSTTEAHVNQPDFPYNLAGNNKFHDVTKTFYDDINNVDLYYLYAGPGGGLAEPYAGNSRNRVVAVLYYEEYNGDDSLTDGSLDGWVDNFIIYDYDIHGNVKQMLTLIADKDKLQEGIFLNPISVNYKYDLISGNVNKVTLQQGKQDQFIHRFSYDADNRITKVETSEDGYIWEEDAEYQYYNHGPLARVLLGDKKVQGIDYVYTLQGWLKGVNNEHLDLHEVGKDAVANNVARDAFSYSLSYYDGDYQPRVNSIASPFALSQNYYASNTDLMNGNVRGMTTALLDVEEQPLDKTFNTYTYDQLNRITAMNSQYGDPYGVVNGNAGPKTSYSYDRNGNLKTLFRSGKTENGGIADMDNLTYHYNLDASNKLINNRLRRLGDAITSNNFDNDIKNHTNNYQYDEIGQLTQDLDENIQNIEWTASGKVRRIEKVTPEDEVYKFEYDGLGNRIAKHDYAQRKVYYYARDAQGNVLAVYEAEDERVGQDPTTIDYDLILESATVNTIGNVLQALNNIEVAGGLNTYTVEPNAQLDLEAGNSITLKPGFHSKLESDFHAKIVNNLEAPTNLEYKISEQHIYGSSRIGINYPKDNIVQTIEDNENYTGRAAAYSVINTELYKNDIGNKKYELSNHLGNVLSVISDRKNYRPGPYGDEVFTPDVIAYNDYYPFGMLQPNRHASTPDYRYGFQGQEMDNEIK
ncbi:3-coathanger stack domain-containing protein, partial [Mesonia sp.]